MTRLLHIVAWSATLAACAVLAPAAAIARTTTPPTGPTAPTTPSRPPLAATLTSCTTGLTAPERTVVFSGSMAQTKTSVSMGMRFELFERNDPDTGTFAKVKVPGWGGWERSDKGVAGFLYDKRVEQLAAPAAYRVLVRYRWYDARGKLVRSAQRTSAACKQPDLRPDLGVSRLLIGGARADGTALYTVTVRNTGRTGVVNPFTTALSVDGVVQPVQSLSALEPDGTATLVFVGPRCAAGAAIVATADAGGTIDEADEADNAERKSCPDPAAPGRT